ncbi:extracellular solute-binding protein [Paenibacillus sp. MBLB4367]|uniref:extracellular solute-binding protein n=1 Tax=Paenibacillus sp. MBLB4367 TaxID=3384767 RepID=UPI0039083BBB
MKREQEYRYLRLADILREQILSGYIKPGEFLLSENELCKYYGMSRTSVRKSLEQLLKEGLIVKKVGQGTIVSPDVETQAEKRRTLRILAVTPSHFCDMAMPTIIETFERRHPSVDVKLLRIPTEQLWTSIRDSREMGIEADLVFVADRHYKEADPERDMVELNRLLEGAEHDMYPRLLEAFSQDGKLLAVPVSFSTVYLAYNPDMFDRYGVEPPRPNWSREDFLMAAKKLTVDTDGDGIVDQYGFSFPPAITRWPVIALQNGVSFTDLNRSGEALFKTLTFIHDILYRDRSATLHLPGGRSQHFTAFMRQKAAMMLTTAIEIAHLKSGDLPFEPRVAQLPFGPEKSTMLIANMLTVLPGCSDMELAAQFIQAALAPDVQEQISRTSGFLSVLKTVNEKVWDRHELESLEIAKNKRAFGLFLHELFDDPQAIDEIEAEMQLFWSGLESAENVAARLSGRLVSRS